MILSPWFEKHTSSKRRGKAGTEGCWEPVTFTLEIDPGQQSVPKEELTVICHQCAIILRHVAVFPTYITCTFYNFVYFHLAALSGTDGIRIHFTRVLFHVPVLSMPYLYWLSVARSSLRHPRVRR